MWRSLNRALLFIEDKFFPNIGIILFITSLIWMMVEAISRQLFSKSFSFSSELVVFTILWAVMFTLAQAGKQGHHINIDLLYQILPKSAVKVLKILSMIIGGIFGFLIFYSAFKHMPHLIETGVRSHSPMRLPMWVVYNAIWIGGLLLTLYYTRAVVKLIKDKKGDSIQ